MEKATPENNAHILEVKGLSTYFYSIHGIAKAVNNVSFNLKKVRSWALSGNPAAVKASPRCRLSD